MNNQEIFILIALIALFIIKIIKFYEGFENYHMNNFPCDKHPFNSNCTCPTNALQKVVLGQFPLNYGEKSPYVYTCVPSDAPEPNTAIF